MGRKPTVWQRKWDGHWYTTGPPPKKEKIRLATKDEGYQVALDRFHAFHASRRTLEPGPTLPLAALLDAFLCWVEKNREPRTLEWYKLHLDRLHAYLGDTFLVAQLRPYHVEKWLAADYVDAGDNFRRNAIRSIQRACNWGVRQGYLTSSPVGSMEKPKQRARELVLTDGQFAQMLASVSPEFADLLTVSWETGLRPQEVRLIEAAHVRGDHIVLPTSKAKGKRGPRVIILTKTAERIIGRCSSRVEVGPIFRNSRGEPWTRNAIRIRFGKLQKSMDLPDLCLTTLRHSWATRAIQAGVDIATVAALMGNSVATVARVYAHLTKDRSTLRAKLESVNASASTAALAGDKDH